MHTTYLPAEALRLLLRLYHRHPQKTALAAAAIYLFFLGGLRLRLGKIRSELLIFALIEAALSVFIAVCLFLLLTRRGFRFL